MVKHLPTMWETRVQSLGREDPLGKEMATPSSILAWKIPWTEDPGRLQSMGSQRLRHDWVSSLHFTSPDSVSVYMKLTSLLLNSPLKPKWFDFRIPKPPSLEFLSLFACSFDFFLYFFSGLLVCITHLKVRFGSSVLLCNLWIEIFFQIGFEPKTVEV